MQASKTPQTAGTRETPSPHIEIRNIDNTGSTDNMHRHDTNTGILKAIRIRELELKRQRNREHRTTKSDADADAGGGCNHDDDDNTPSHNTGSEYDKDQCSILSPHNSVFEALQNPDLNMGIDLSTLKSKVLSTNNNNNNNNNNSTNPNIEAPIAATMSQLHLQFNQDHDPNNLDFSITSWQNISSYFNSTNTTNNNLDSRSNSQNSINNINYNNNSNNNNNNHSFFFNMSSNNNSNIISSGNGSPYMKNNDDISSSNTPNRLDSPNIGSILSGVSGNDDTDDNIRYEREKEYNYEYENGDDDNSIDGLQIIQTKTPSLYSKSHSYHNKQHTKNGNDSIMNYYESDTELDNTVDSSTIISSFVMPRVSIHSNITTSNIIGTSQLSNYSINRSKLNIRIVGQNNNSLMKRFQSYKKTLTNIEFFINNCELTDLIILIVDKDNYMLPKITKTPCIPIILSSNDLLISNKIPNYLKLCESIKLNSLNDNLINLIDFLSNINDLNTWKSFLSSLPKKSYSNDIININSSLIEFHSENRNNSSILPFSKESFINKCENGKDNNDNGKEKKSLFNGSFNFFIIAGVTVGILSIGIIFIWRKISTIEFITANSEKPKFTSSIFTHQQISKKEIENYSNQSFDHIIISKLKTITHTIEYLGDLVFSQSVTLFQRAKIILIELLN
ncbi:hypothetical protein C6P40_000649 [Pichia californica]|uniref:Uncharacterized protein n=1 Tax=Pichia californica TaxID=460514 RepID=A0A9P7BHT5_9ASCO|nr:hypothetical protein C6P42_001987 [[Candida] californica]KAG0690935.1 hypothetical protein C6P40_000649 [[Candida] californica]